MNENYFEPREVTLSLCQCDIDILAYVFNNVDWSNYNAENFGGEDANAASIHLADIEEQLGIEEEE